MARDLRIAIVATLVVVLASCGVGNNSKKNGEGGGTGLSVSGIQPSSVVVDAPPGTLTVSGQGFTTSSQVLLNGEPLSQTTFLSSTSLQAPINSSVNRNVGTYEVSVQDAGKVSNSLPYTVYAPQQGSLLMKAIPGFLVAENLNDPPFIVATDVNGDGLADVVMSGPGITNSESIAILDGQSDGTLTTPQYVPVPATPYALGVGDVDGNGTADLVSINSDNSSSTTVSLLLGDGHGNFQPAVTQQTFSAIYPQWASLVDLDGDGKPDLVLAVRETGGSVATDLVWLKNTGGAFAAPITISMIANYDFVVADFNGDGKPDILYTNNAGSSQALHILVNQGNGKFVDQAAGGLNGIVGVPTVVDFNLDGIPDLIVEAPKGNAAMLYSFSGQGNGSFTQVANLNIPAPISLVSGDFDHDGFPDLAGPSGTEPSEILYFFGDGHGNFTIQPVVGPEGAWVAVGDFNGDGIPDVVVPDQFSFVSLALGRKDRNFPSPIALSPATMTGLSTGDINGDELPEILVGGDLIDSIPGTVFQNLGNGAFQLAATTDPSSFMLADLSGKGVVDLLGGNTNLEIWPNNGTFSFGSSPITFAETTANVAVSDMDRDGLKDVVSACGDGLCPGQIFFNEDSYQFTPMTITDLSFPYVIGDFNGDGKPDIATGSSVFLNDGNRSFKEVVTNSLPLSNGVLAVVGDFNGDGKDDVALNLPGDTVISIWYSRGDGTFYEGTVVDPGQYPGAISVGDFNGDGRLDLAVGLMLSQQACLLLNSGNGQFSRSFFASGASAVAIVTSDLNADGKPDLVIGNFVLSFESANVNVVFHQ